MVPSKVTRLDIIDNKVDTLQEDVVEIKSDIKSLKSDVHTLKSDVHTLKSEFGGMYNMLEKILEKVTLNQGSINKRLNHLEHHTAHPPLID